MATKAERTQPVDLEALDAFLMSASAPADSMGLSDLDGFLTGLAVGPELVEPSAWLPLIWGGDEPEFATPEEGEAIVAIIMARYKEIIARLDADLNGFDPVFLEGEEDQVIVADWAAGFMDAVILRAKAWQPILEDEEGRALMSPLLVLGSDNEQPLFNAAPLPQNELQKVTADGANILMDTVPTIYQFWRERRP
jgi:uncharacterized protein